MNVLRTTTRIGTAAALVVNAYIHFVLAVPFDGVAGALLSQGDLFRIQGVANLIVGILIVVVPKRWSGLAAAAIAAGGLVMLIASVLTPLDLSGIGFPVIYEPVWYPQKVVAVIAQVLALVGGCLVAALTSRLRAVRKQN